MFGEYDPADWWKGNDYSEDGYGQQSKPAEVDTRTETEKKIDHYEKRAREHFASWKEYQSKTYLYHYKQCNLKVRKLKGAMK